MSTKSIRADRDTHVRLLELSAASGDSLIDTMRYATEALRRQRFGRTVATEVATLRADPAAWAGYLAEADSTTVIDGLSR